MKNAQVFIQPFRIRERLRFCSRVECQLLVLCVQVYHLAMSATIAIDIVRMQSATMIVALRSRVWRMDLV
jgi:hypothetical protein